MTVEAAAAMSGVGSSEDPVSARAGEEAARAALQAAGTDRPDLVLLFSTERHDPVALHAAVRSVVGPGPRLVGGYSMGIVTNDRLGYDGFQVGVAALSCPGMDVDLFIEEGLPDHERDVGLRLGRAIRGKAYRGEESLLLFYDAVKRSAAEGLAMNLGTPLLEGLSAGLRGWPPRAAGMGLFGSMQFNPTSQWLDDRVTQQSAIAAVLSGDVRMDVAVMHGCRPSGAYHRITKVDRNVVLEIDERPARLVIGQLLGDLPGWEDLPLFVTLGVNRGEKFGPYREEDYATRLVMAVDRERDGLVMFEPALRPGMELQLMRRSVDFAYVAERAQALMRGLDGRTPFFALYIDCGARAGAYCGSDGEDAAEVQRVIGRSVPLLGIYSGVEIARVGGEMQALNFTGVLCVLSR